jgi:hypothetical protein
MPDKEGAEEKSTTKEVVNKKQKQMMGEEGYDVARDEGRVKPSKDKKDGTSYPVSDEVRKTQKKNEGPSALEIVKKKYGKAVMDVEKKKNVSEEGKSLLSTPGLDKLKKIKDFKSNADRVFGRKSPDITKVAESFGGEIIGEPVELDEMIGAMEMPKIDIIGGLYGAGTMLDQIRRNITIPNLGIKDKSKKVFDKIKNIMKSTTRTDQEDNTKGGTSGGTEQQRRYRNRRRKQLNQDTYNKTKDKFFNNKNNKNNNKKSNLRKAAEFGAGASTFGAGTLVGTQLNKGKKGKLPKFRPKLPQTSHNIGRTSNPQ